MTTPYIGQDAYNKFDVFDSLSYNCVEYLMEHDELLWRLMYYKTPTAWKTSVLEPDLTHAQKSLMVYDGTEDSTKYYVFLDTGSPDVITYEQPILRISPYFAAAENRSVGIIEISFEVSCHYKINHLTNYKTRTAMMAKRIIELFNGADVGGLGLLYMDRAADQNTKATQAFQAPQKGYQLIMTTNVAVK